MASIEEIVMMMFALYDALSALPEKKMSFHQIKPRAPRRASQERSQRGGESAGPACGPSQPGPSEVSRWDWGKQ